MGTSGVFEKHILFLAICSRVGWNFLIPPFRRNGNERGRAEHVFMVTQTAGGQSAIIGE
jgi:hypothetical protein